jgi:hypothetical protein
MPTQRAAGQKYQGTDEAPSYEFDWTDIGVPSQPIVFTLWELNPKVDVSADHLQGDAIVDGNKVYSPLVNNLELGKTYLLRCRAMTDFGRLSAYIKIFTEL